jgi:WD40 repeat protein
LAAAGEDGTRLWDVPAGREVAHLPTGHSGSALFPPGDISLITYGKAGLQRWRMQPDQLKSGVMGFDPPVVLETALNADRFRAVASQSGEIIAYLGDRHEQTIVGDVKTLAKKIVLKGRGWDVALSPDARWAAVGHWRNTDTGATVWDLTTRERVWHLPHSDPSTESCHVGFSPDGRWLVTGEQDKYRFWQVGSWAPGLVIPRDRLEPLPGPVAFSRDSRMLAIAKSFSTVELVEPATGREIATLPAPDPQPINSMCFSPDAGQLAVATDNHVIQLWDLRLIRRQLEELNLDWELSPPK